MKRRTFTSLTTYKWPLTGPVRVDLGTTYVTAPRGSKVAYANTQGLYRVAYVATVDGNLYVATERQGYGLGVFLPRRLKRVVLRKYFGTKP